MRLPAASTPTSNLSRQLVLPRRVMLPLKLWQFKPIDATDEQLEAQRKARRQGESGARNGEPTGCDRERFISLRWPPSPSRGLLRVSHAGHGSAASKPMSQGVVPTILTKAVPDLASPSSVESQRGYHDGVLVEKHQLEAMESEKMDTNASSSPGLVTDLASSPLRTALDNLARARDAKLVRYQESSGKLLK